MKLGKWHPERKKTHYMKIIFSAWLLGDCRSTRSVFWCTYIYIYIYMYVYMCVCIYIYTYMYDNLYIYKTIIYFVLKTLYPYNITTPMFHDVAL